MVELINLVLQQVVTRSGIWAAHSNSKRAQNKNGGVVPVNMRGA